MANLLRDETVAAIRQLAKNGWSNRRVARELNVNRGTVARHLASADAPDEADTKVSRPGPKSLCSRYENDVLRLIEGGCSARAIHAELQRHHEFVGSYPSVQRFVKQLKVNANVPPSRKNEAVTWILNLQKGEFSAAELAVEFHTTNDVETLAKCLRKGNEKERIKAAVVFARKKGISKAFYKRIAWFNARSEFGLLPRVEVIPLPACAQVLNVIESVFSGMARAIIHNSNYARADEAKRAIDAYFAQRNRHFQNHPKRAGNKIWGRERTPPVFSESNVCKDPRYR